MNPDVLKRLFPRASASVLAVNLASNAAGIPDAKPAKQTRALDSHNAKETQGAGRHHVCFTLCRVQLLDVDAKYGSVKDALDFLATCGAIHGDREDQISLEVRQEKVRHYRDEKTVIEIYQLP